MTDAATIKQTTLSKQRWNSFKLYNGYRVLIAFLLFFSIAPASEGLISIYIAPLYLLFSIIAAIATWFERPKFDVTLPLQMIVDIIFILLFMYATNTSHTSIGLLLVITIAAASLISEGKLALFYAALASIGILFGQFIRSLIETQSADNYTTAAMLSIACFTIAWLAHSLAKRMHLSEQLASQRGLDLENLAQVNNLIAQKIEDGVLVVDTELKVKHLNTHAAAYLNADSSQMIDKNLDEVSPPIAKLLLEWMRQDDVGQDSVNSTIQKVNIHAQELRISFLPVSENENKGAVIFLDDWSHLQTQSHQVKLAALGRLTANIAHEIRNPLSAISHANQLMQEDEEVTPSNRRMLQIISDNVGRVDQIIKNVLELNRRDRTNQEIVHLESFITDFYNQFCAVENIANHQFILTIKDIDSSILFDRRHLNQILWNLCKNGWRHSRQQDNSLRLDINVNNKSNLISMEVTNDGDAIPENIRNNLFEPFFTTEETGTGLGLYISRELAEANGGNLQHKPSKDGTKFIMLIKRATI